jgi:TRAP transporter TAXI family solute receptor
MSRRRVMTMLVVLAMAACDTPPVAPPQRLVRLTTGTPGAGFHPLGAALVRQYLTVLPGVAMEVQESAGSVTNVRALQQGSADLGFAFADVAYVAYIGQLEETSTPFDRLRGIAVLQLTPLHVIVRAGAPIEDLTDLRGRRVGVGPAGSGTALTSSLVLSAFSVGAGDFTSERLAFNDAAAQLVEGRLDAAFVNAGYPAAAVEIAARAGGRLLPVRGPAIERLRAAYPFLRLSVIPGGTYPGHPNSIETVGVDTILLCRADLDETLVYDLTRGFFDILPVLSSERESLRLMDVEQAPATPIPLHAGAARYYRERELFR